MRIVAGVDFSETSQGALHEAFKQAKLRDAIHPEIHAVVVLDDGAATLPGKRSRTSLDQVIAAIRSDLTDVIQKVRAEEVGSDNRIPVTLHIRIGEPVDQLVSVAAELEAELIVVGTHGKRGVRRLVLGSVAERVARTAPCPVLIVRPLDRAAFAAVPRPEPAPPGGVIDDGPHVEHHRYAYSSALDAEPPPNHLL